MTAPQVVFACRKNGGRSVISRLLNGALNARHRVIALSAGTEPGDRVHPEVTRILEQLGLDTSRETPKLLTRDMIAGSDLAVTLGCGEECPYVPGVRYVDWPVADPKGQTLPLSGASWPTWTSECETCWPTWSPSSPRHPRSSVRTDGDAENAAAGAPVDLLSDDVCVTGMASRLLEHADQHPPQVAGPPVAGDRRPGSPTETTTSSLAWQAAR